MRKIDILIFALILIFATAVRIYHLSEVPPSLNWDEASIGYDAWAITQDGKDQWGKTFPPIFKSFGEYKYPAHIYTTALAVKLFGLSDFTVRLPSALMGVVVLALLFWLVCWTTKSKFLAFTAMIFLSISPWHIQFSRVNWETNFTLFFFLLGLISFTYGLEKRSIFLPFAYILFGIDIFTYNAAKVFIPLFVGLLTFIYIKQLFHKKFISILSLCLFALFILFNIFNTQLSGKARFQQVSFSAHDLNSTYLYQLTKNNKIASVEIVFRQYLLHFSPQFLFISGDNNPRHSTQTMGELYWTDLLFIPLGLLVLIKNKIKRKFSLIFLAWFFLAPVPSAIVKEAPHASRSMFALGGWQIISAFGFSSLLNYLASYRRLLIGAITLFLGLFVWLYYNHYFSIYPKQYSGEWQYGYKKIFTDYKAQFNQYDKIIISDYLAQPYIFALYYLQYKPAQFRAEVEYNPIDQWGFSVVKSFSNFLFQPVNEEVFPKGRLLIFASQKEKLENMKPKDIIMNLDNNPAFYVYEYQK